MREGRRKHEESQCFQRGLVGAAVKFMINPGAKQFVPINLIEIEI